MTFARYPVEQAWWSFNDYQAVLDVMARLRPARVLEFGPGSSTLALIEGGAARIDACEDDPVYADRLLKNVPDAIVHLHAYTWRNPLSIPALDEKVFDLALIDGPRTTTRRPTVIRYAMARCAAVLVPTEDFEHADRSFFRPILRQLAEEFGWSLEIAETGRIAGGFGLLQKPSCRS